MNYVGVLKGLRNRVVGVESLRDPVLRGAIERYLHLAIEALIDVGARLCSVLRLRKPERYRDIARILGENGVLGEDEARRFELWIGFRNILVHGYAQLDPEKILEALSEVEELERIVERIGGFIHERNLDPGDGAGLGELVDRVRKVLEKRSFIIFAYIFGSKARGERGVKGDVDVAIYTSRDLTWREFVEILNELEDALGTRVDLVHLNKAPLTLAYEIVAKGIPILDRDPERRVDFEVRIVKEFLDFEPLLERYYEALLRRDRRREAPQNHRYGNS